MKKNKNICNRKSKLKEIRSEILLTEYKETITTLRNWDVIVYGSLTVIATIISAVITYSIGVNKPIEWGIIFSLFLFWLFTYIWISKLAEIRIDVLIEIENELDMKGQYSKLRKIKQVKLFAIWVLLPYLSAIIIGPFIGYIISKPYEFINGFMDIIKTILFLK